MVSKCDAARARRLACRASRARADPRITRDDHPWRQRYTGIRPDVPPWRGAQWTRTRRNYVVASVVCPARSSGRTNSCSG